MSSTVARRRVSAEYLSAVRGVARSCAVRRCVLCGVFHVKHHTGWRRRPGLRAPPFPFAIPVRRSRSPFPFGQVARRPGGDMVLLEPMERRATWLQEVVTELRLPSVEVVRARAEEMHGKLSATVVVARAVAPMDRLAGWTLPLLATGGVLLAMKGSRATDELRTAAAAISRLGGGAADVVLASSIEGVTPTTVVRVVKQRPVPTPLRQGTPRASRRRSR